MPGYYFEEFEIGHVFRHAIRRTVTEADNVLFSALTHNPAPLHIDSEYMRTRSEFGRPLVNSFFTLGLIVGISINDTTLGTTVANLGMEEVRFPHPLFPGDTVHVETEVLAKRLSRSRPGNGILTLMHRGNNQHEVLVAVCRRAVLMLCKPACAPLDGVMSRAREPGLCETVACIPTHSCQNGPRTRPYGRRICTLRERVGPRWVTGHERSMRPKRNRRSTS
jgi:acyl dehydratase